MRRARLGLALGAISAIAAIAACALDETGLAGDGGGPDVITVLDGGPDADAAEDVTYDVPDLGVGETESGLPCTCVTGVPVNYVVVEYDPTQRVACTPGYGTSADLEEVLSSPSAQCSCSCNGTPTTAPSCACGNDPATFTLHGGMSDCTAYNNVTVKANNGSCFTTPQTLPITGNGGAYMLAIPSSSCAASGGQCGPGTPKQTLPDASIAQGRSCDQTAASGACNGGVCLPSPESGYELCITNHTAATSCNAFPDFPEAHLVGDNVVDNRGCSGTCGCGIVDAGSCGDPVLELWNTANNCAGPADVVLDASCSQANEPNNPTFNSTRYDVPHSGGACGVTSSTSPTGGVVPTNRYVICCRP